jgi:hypothetical protein
METQKEAEKEGEEEEEEEEEEAAHEEHNHTLRQPGVAKNHSIAQNLDKCNEFEGQLHVLLAQ